MASIGQIRDAIRTTLEANIANFRTYARHRDVVQGPCGVVMPDKTDFSKSFGRGTDQHAFKIYVLVPRNDLETSQTTLDELVDGSGSNSIRKVIFNNRTLGLSDVDAHVVSMSDYGGTMKLGAVDYVGAELGLNVITVGT